MPGAPRIDKGEGFIRSHDLLQALRADIDSAYATLENDRESQYLRRCVVRAVFSYIEALVEAVKVELRSTIRLGEYAGELSDKERETLGPLHVIGNTESGKFLPLDTNIKRTFRLAAKVWNLHEFKLSSGGEDFQDFLAAKSARNRLTHPRTFYDIEVTDHDMHCHTIAGMWVQAEFHRLFDVRVRAIVAGLPEEDRPALLDLLKSPV
ncbi:hypothetical protein [Pandoraea cepalis]|uniref:RiboL-PSP-HEPN domain-containing protein n=1 Tax=Pandoraea cepalis TaxID=2508294 RepID=A0A5E4YPK3_9BURK|nr:hypothetical protein [Pandoraea cepalis]VVE50417.1 hypothetical protein PCE31107_04669 [Pandoraea cepalis]